MFYLQATLDPQFIKERGLEYPFNYNLTVFCKHLKHQNLHECTHFEFYCKSGVGM